MKKICQKIIYFTMGMTLITSITGCGGKASDSITTTTAIETNNSIEESINQTFLFEVSGKKLEYPITRNDLEQWIADNNLEIIESTPYSITCKNSTGDNIHVSAIFLGQNRDICTYMKLKGDHLGFEDIFSSDDGDANTVREQLAANSPDVFIHKNMSTAGFGFTGNSSGIICIANYNKTLSSFELFLNKEHSENDGYVATGFNGLDGYYLSSTDKEGLYLITPKETDVQTKNYFYNPSLNQVMDKAEICKYDSPYSTVNKNLEWENQDNIWYGKNSSGTIEQVYEYGLNENEESNSLNDFQAFCAEHKITVNSEEILSKITSEGHYIEVIQNLNCIITIANEKAKSGYTISLREDSIEKGENKEGNPTCSFKATIDEYPDLQIIFNCVESANNFSVGINLADLSAKTTHTLTASKYASAVISSSSKVSSKFNNF